MTSPAFRRPSPRRVAAGLAAVTLAFTVAACADGEDTAGTDAATVEETATDAETTTEEAEDTGAEETTGTEETAAEDTTEPGEGESTQVGTADGNTVLVDPEFGEQINQHAEEWGAPWQVQANDAGSVATFEDGNLLAHSEEGGVQPVVGMIAQTWVDDGALTNPVGLPTGPERENEEESGWSQDFTNGTITWARDDSGEFTATVS